MKSLAITGAASGVLFALVGYTAGITPDAGRDVGPAELEAERETASAVERAPMAAGGTARPGHAHVEPPPDVPPEELTAVVRRLCAACHNDAAMTGNLSLEDFDVAEAAEHAETAEKMIAKLRLGMMPPPGIPRPGGDTLLALAETLETVLDEAAAAAPDPGTRTFQRLNRAEYERSIEDLLALEIDAGRWLPLDVMSANFDNIADVQAVSPTLLDAYLSAAAEISRMAVGYSSVTPLDRTYTNESYVSQRAWDYVEGAPYGTRGGLVVSHHFPADGEYVFSMEFDAGRASRFQDIDISIDGERVALLPYGDHDVLKTDPIFVRAGQHRVSAAFIRTMDGPYEDLITPHDWSLAGGGASSYGTTSLPHLSDLVISGPYNPTGTSATASRERIFTCRPASPAEARPCAEAIIDRLGSQAFRRPLADGELDALLSFYAQGAEKGGFEIGIRTALQAILASPHFVFRLEQQPEGIEPGEVYRMSDLGLASRLSYFLWGLPPDEELLGLAREGRLSDEDVLEQQTRRMLADPRSEALGTRFAAQWLRLQDLDKVHPDAYWFPNYDQQLADAMRSETVLFFNDLVREDRSMFRLFDADYTFLNETLAEHYDIPGINGSTFRRVEYPDGMPRRGILGHGSVLVLTSLGNRTSPVLRGKWVMEVLLNNPPPPPPPGVPDLEETEGSKDGRFLTTRERMEMHRADPVCHSCHQYMDPIGLALDNFSVTGTWRTREKGMPLDTRGTFYDGTPVEDPRDLSAALLKRPTPLARAFTVNLMAYALGRRVEHYDQPTVRAITEQAAADDYRMSSLILGVVESDAFRMKRALPAPAVADDSQGAIERRE